MQRPAHVKAVVCAGAAGSWAGGGQFVHYSVCCTDIAPIAIMSFWDTDNVPLRMRMTPPATSTSSAITVSQTPLEALYIFLFLSH